MELLHFAILVSIIHIFYINVDIISTSGTTFLTCYFGLATEKTSRGTLMSVYDT